MKKFMSMVLTALLILASVQPLRAAGSISGQPLDSIRMTDLFSVIDSISDELENGTVIINGKDQQENRCCGILHEDGSVERVEEYTALYPLAGDHFLAVSEDTDSSFLDMSNGGCLVPICDAGVHGVILDSAGKVLYEQDPAAPYQKMFRINDEKILVLAVHEEDGSAVLEAGELDADGKWLISLSTELPAQSRMDSYLEPVMNQDGYRWSLKEDPARFCYKSVNYENGQTTTLQFIDCSSEESTSNTQRKNFNLAFSSQLEMMMLFRAPIPDSAQMAFFDELNAETYLFKGISPEDPNGLTLMTPKQKVTFFENADEPISVLGCGRVEGTSSLICFAPGEKMLYSIDQKAKLDQIQPYAMKLNPNLTENMTGTPVLAGNRMAILSEPNEKGTEASALTLVNLDGDILSKKSISHLAAHAEGVFRGDVLVLNDRENGALQVIDADSGSIRYYYSSSENQKFMDPRVLFGKYVTFRVDEEQEQDHSFFGFSFSGEKKEVKTDSYFCFVDPDRAEPYEAPIELAWTDAQSAGCDTYVQALTNLQNDPANDFRSYYAAGTLYDLDDDGVQELIAVYYRMVSGQGICCVADVYTKINGQVVSLMKEELVAVCVGAQAGRVNVVEKDGQSYLQLRFSDTHGDPPKGPYTHTGSVNMYVVEDGRMAQADEAHYSYVESNTGEMDDEQTKVTINRKDTTMDDYHQWIDSFTTILDSRTDFLDFEDLFVVVRQEEGNQSEGENSAEESSTAENSDSAEENSAEESSSQEESSQESTPEESSSSGMAYFSDDELVNYSWNCRAAANAKWDGQGEIPNGTEYLGQIHFTREDGTYINYAVFRQYGIFKGQYNSFIWWGRRGSLSGMMEARDSGLLWQCPGLSSYYSYYGVGSLTEFYNYMLVNELNKGYTAAYCDVEGLPL